MGHGQTRQGRDLRVTEFRKALQRGKSVAVDRCNHTRAQRHLDRRVGGATAGSTTGAGSSPFASTQAVPTEGP